MINNTVDGTFHPSDECRGASLDLHWLCTTHAGRDILLSTSSLNRGTMNIFNRMIIQISNGWFRRPQVKIVRNKAQTVG